MEYSSIGHLFGISRSTACIIVHEVCSAINTVLTPIYIKIPTEQQLKEIIDMFEKKWGFPQCAGAIDGSHIPIIAPTECHTDYFNRKGWHSIILQGVVGLTYKFWDINVGWPGRVHDARVFSRSLVYKRASEGSLFPRMEREINLSILLIGDPAYPLYEWLMKLFSDTGRLSSDQHAFNYRLSCARNVVENAYGRLKACLHCGKMNPDPIRIQSGSVVSGSDVVRLRPHCNNRKKYSHVRASRVPSACLSSVN